MSDLPENLQVIKIEPTTPTPSSPDKCTNHTKERLNLHVKRRLQQDTNAAILEPVSASNDSLLNMNNVGVVSGEQTKRRGPNSNQKETTSPKTRRPYQKRVDKTKLDGSVAAASFIGSGGGGGGGGIKNKKMTSTATLIGGNGPNAAHITSPKNNTLDALDDSFEQEACGGGSVIGGPEIESSKACGGTSRDKDKFPDILSMVLSVKKRALMQDSEVQEMLSKIMEVVKS